MHCDNTAQTSPSLDPNDNHRDLPVAPESKRLGPNRKLTITPHTYTCRIVRLTRAHVPPSVSADL
jgi:hypothetical protein